MTFILSIIILEPKKRKAPKSSRELVAGLLLSYIHSVRNSLFNTPVAPARNNRQLMFVGYWTISHKCLFLDSFDQRGGIQNYFFR